MGRRKLVPFLEDISGKFSKIVFSRNLAGPYFRKYVIPTNPKTDAQLDMRKIITEASRDWQSLSDSEQGYWRNYISIYKDWYIGSAENVSAFNCFVSISSQIKAAIETGQNTSIINNSDWDIEPWTYSKTVQPGSKPPLNLSNINNFTWVYQVVVESGIPKVSLTINLEGNTMLLGSKLKTTDNREVAFVVWLSNPGKYRSSNMKPMVIKALHSNSLKIKKEGSQVPTIQLKSTVNQNYFRLAPKVGEYVVLTLGLQTKDGPYAILTEEIIQV